MPASLRSDYPINCPGSNGHFQSGTVAHFHRNMHRFTEHDLATFLLEGDSLKPRSAKELEKAVAFNPNDIQSRTFLLGYCFTRHHFSKPNRILRRAHILWIVQHLADHPFLTNPSLILFKDEDPEGYKLVKALWLKQLGQHPSSAQVFANAAVALFMSDPPEAKEIVLRARKIDPELPAVKSALKRIGVQEKLVASGTSKNDR